MVPTQLPMISKLCAGWLVVLILAPFTAPFPTCDLASLLGHTAHHTATLAAQTSAVVRLGLTNTTCLLLPPPTTRREEKENKVLALSRLPGSGLAALSTAEQPGPAASTAAVDIQPASATILRL
jgi:hypothetical protein